MHMHEIKISIVTLGCKVNQYDSAALSESLENHGYTLVPFSARADFYIVNTCAVTEKTEAQSRQFIRRALREHPCCQIIATGCYAQKSMQDLQKLSQRVHVVGNREKNDIPLYIEKIFSTAGHVNAVTDITLEKQFSTQPCTRFFEKTRAFLKIQDGCNSRCSYCIVPSVRGVSRSLPMSEVITRLHLIVQSGYREVVLTGIHLGAYGLDQKPGESIEELLKYLGADTQLSRTRIRLSSIEPTEISAEVISIFATSHNICPHLHIPLQSGDDSILRKMKRPYMSNYFKNLILQLSSTIPDVNIGVDIIVGFPGETNEHFQHTVAFIQELPVGYLHVFPYSRRPGTPAAQFADHVAEPVKKKRVQILRSLSDEKKHSFYAAYRNHCLSVLVEGKRDDSTNLLKGYSKNYIPVMFAGPDHLIGKEIPVKVVNVEKGDVYGVTQL